LVENDVTSSSDYCTVEYKAEGSNVTLGVVGELDLATVGVLTAHFDRAITDSDGPVTVNLAGVTFVDSSALHALLRAHAALAAAGRSLVVAEARPATMRVFQLACLVDTLGLGPQPD
jgi:anti-anti-sigma factor